MKKFEIGKTYTMHSPCNQECTWTYEVTARTAQTVTLSDGKQTKRCRICRRESEWCGCEIVHPLGVYSMCPTLRAE